MQRISIAPCAECTNIVRIISS